MSKVKGKIKLCSTAFDDFNYESINGFPFYKRYQDFIRIFEKYLPDIDAETLLAQPVEVSSKGILVWYVKPWGEKPIRVANLKGMEHADAEKQKNHIVERLKDVINEALPNDVLYLDCVLKSLGREGFDNAVYYYDNKLTFSTWGMTVRKGHSIASVITDAVGEHRTHTITYSVEGKGILHIKQNPFLRLHGHILNGPQDIPSVESAKYYVFKYWKPVAPQGQEVVTNLDYCAVCEHGDVYNLIFKANVGGHIEGDISVDVKKGTKITSVLPAIVSDEDFSFIGWQPNIEENTVVTGDAVYTAVFEKKKVELPPAPELKPAPDPVYHTVRFESGENGILPEGFKNEFKIKDGEHIPQESIPAISAKKGYRFTTWDTDIDIPVTNDIVIKAQYEKKPLPWYKRLWQWLIQGGCLKWLLWLLLLLLFIILLGWLLPQCHGTHESQPVNGVVPPDSIETSDGRVVEDNGVIKPITDDSGRLPDGEGIVAPVMSEGGKELPIVEQPGVPDIIGNRLFLFMENENDNIENLAKDFKQAYPEDKYSIIGFDREVKLLVIQIPENERNQIRQTINSRIPNHKFFVFDEEIYELNGQQSEQPNSANRGWHLNAIHLVQGWRITKGSPNVTIAVIDDGIDAGHPIFRGRITNAYNVFTQNNRLSYGEGHGTHTAGLAAGSMQYYNQGASGVAPLCKLMPVQVFDNQRCPLSALIAGVMYAVHHNADVINISVGPSFEGLNQLPVEQQEQIARNQFKNVEYLWARVCKLAAKKKAIIVFSAGNDDIISSIPPENRNAAAVVVTAVDRSMQPTSFTNYGIGSDISAPGKDIYSSYPVNSFRMLDGTSMAAPIVSGVVALMKSMRKDISVQQVRNVLLKGGMSVRGNVPPMVLADHSLQLVRSGDFSAPKGEMRQSDEFLSVPADNGRRTPEGNTDYDKIRALIQEYEKKISELKKLLPEHRK